MCLIGIHVIYFRSDLSAVCELNDAIDCCWLFQRWTNCVLNVHTWYLFAALVSFHSIHLNSWTSMYMYTHMYYCVPAGTCRYTIFYIYTVYQFNYGFIWSKKNQTQFHWTVFHIIKKGCTIDSQNPKENRWTVARTFYSLVDSHSNAIGSLNYSRMYVIPQNFTIWFHRILNIFLMNIPPNRKLFCPRFQVFFPFCFRFLFREMNQWTVHSVRELFFLLLLLQ